MWSRKIAPENIWGLVLQPLLQRVLQGAGQDGAHGGGGRAITSVREMDDLTLKANDPEK